MPGPKCIVRCCHRIKKSLQDCRLTFHKLPRDTELKKIWLYKIGIEDEDTDYGFVCSKHFKPEDYIRDLQAELLGYIGRRKLKPEAIPSRNLPYEEVDVTPEEKERLERERHKKLIQDCLKEDVQERSILSFELFKKLRYSRTRRGRKPKNPRSEDEEKTVSNIVLNIQPHEILHPNDDDSQVVVLTLPSGEERVVHISSLEATVDSIQDDSLYDMDSSEDILGEAGSSMDTPHTDDPDYLKRKVKKLENQVSHQKRVICKLRRQIVREKKMMEKIIIATNSGQALPDLSKKKIQYDEKSKAALLHIYSLAPQLYSGFSKTLDLPPESVITSWEPNVNHSYQQVSSREITEGVAEEDFQEQDLVEEEFIVESEEYVPD